MRMRRKPWVREELAESKFFIDDATHNLGKWHEAFKKLHRKTSQSGIEVGIKLDNDILTRGLRQGDVLAINEDNVIAVNIPKDKALVVKVDDTHLVPKVCYEIGNRHATLFEGSSHNEFITIYSEPMKEMLEKIGANVTVEEIQFDFNKSISSSINAHHH